MRARGEVGTASSASKDKRADLRIEPYVASCVIVHGDRRVGGYLIDLSIGGGRAACEGEPPAERTRVEVEFRIGRQTEPLRVKATVRWTRPGPRGLRAVGFRFERLGPGDRQALETLVRDFRHRVAELGQG